ncbi:myc box-dependent-interacting protein 1b isoform X2 [Girardinichthys multiradiatus]|uniref:myc box-dependent-interacting protein 1b isoform X2 n=1 Tax=Girardinichthys multiradiatus TaxID=208333 RepID=UPI001FAC39C3|nr:myc box-dependent-interacting protein 1b isoform X2 [Girardinichthys multiradiatus]
MAEIGKGVTAGKLALNVQKRLSRAQEKVLQKLGKADETRDTAFEELVANFNKQMTEGSKVQRDLKAYLAAVKAMHDASRRLQDCLADMYEPDWFGKEEMDALVEEMIEKELDNNLEDTDTLWLGYHQNLTDKTLLCMDTYLAQFPEIKARIAKRERKLVDFDSARHHFASLQKGKKKDEAKIAKAEEELGRAQKIFEELNVELQDELPVLWDSRVGVYVGTFQSLAGQQDRFHKEMSKLSQNLNDVMTKLEEQRELKKDATAATKKGDGAKSEEANHSESTSPAPKKPGPPPSRPPPRFTPSPDPKQQNVGMFEEEASPPDTNTNSTSTTQKQCEPWSGVNLLDWDVEVFQPVTIPVPKQDQTNTDQVSQHEDDKHQEETQSGWDYSDSSYQNSAQPSRENTETTEGQESWTEDQEYAAQSYIEPNWDNDGASVGQGDWGEEEESSVTNGSDAELPPGFLYKVKAVHEYTATDNDELELKVGDAVLVLAFDNPDEQDDGWLLGVKESHWFQKKDISAKGVFPENFTQKV